MRPLLLFSILLCSAASAQTNVIRHLGLEDGVGGVQSLALDPNGDVWLATLRGLVRHDGVRFVPEAPGPTRAVAVGDDGTVWAWAGSALTVRPARSQRYVAVPLPDALRPTFTTRWRMYLPLRTLSDGGLLVIDPPSGLWKLHRDGQRWTRLFGSRPGEAVADAVETRPGEVAVLTNKRLGLIDLKAPRATRRWLLRVQNGRHVRVHPDGLWIAADEGLFLRRHDGRVRTILSPQYRCWFTDPSVAPDGTLALTIEKPGEKAVYIVDPDGVVLYQLRLGQELATLPTALRFDSAGALWIAGSSGLSYAEDLGWLRIYPLQASSIMGLTVSPQDGTLWAGTYGGGLLHFNGTAFDRLWVAPDLDGATTPTFDADGAARGIAFGGRPFRREGYRWLGTQGGRASYRRRPVAQDVAGGTGMFNLTDADEVQTVALGEREIGPGVVTAFTRTPRRVWLAIDQRLDVLSGEGLGGTDDRLSISLRRVLSAFHGLRVYALERDAYDRIWVATERGLCVVYETGPDVWTVHFFGPDDGMDLGAVSDLALSGDDLWLATSTGLRRYALHAERPWARTRPVGRISALLPVESVSHVAVDGEGTVWVVPNGLATLYRLRPETEALPSPETRVSEWRINERSVRVARGRADTTRVAIAFAPRSMQRVEEIRIEYRLPALDTTWVALHGEPTVRFDRLAPGRYRVEARSVRTGQTAGPTLIVPFVLAPPFWRAPWFLGLLALVIVFATGGAVARRERRQSARAAALEAVVSVRTAELREAKEETDAQAHRLVVLDEAKGRFFQNISHELRTPLTLLLGPLRDARSTHDGQAILGRQIPFMRRAGERLLGLVDELLDLARLDVGTLRLNRQPVELVSLTQQTVTAMALQASEDGLTLSFDAETASLSAYVDAVRYEQVLSNLLANAFKFTPSGGKVRVELARTGDNIRLAVRDTGQGIPPDQIENVFERFHQVDDRAVRPGAGIGLALVRELVQLHGGTIQAKSTLGFGSTFTVVLPVGQHVPATDPLTREPVASRRIEEHPGPLDDVPETESERTGAPGATVLVVEDHADLRNYLADMLLPVYHVLTASDGQDGLAIAQRLAKAGAPPDLILSDVMMPGMDGVTLCRTLKADPLLGHVPVVLLTARADEGSRLEGLSVGADDYLAKPFSADELFARMENLIEMRRYLRQRLADTRPDVGSGLDAQSDGSRQLRDGKVEEALWIQAVRGAAGDHLGDSAFGTDWLAELIGLSTRQFRRRLKAAIGLTPGAFLRSLRLERAAALLEIGDGSLSDVASAVGYSDADSFSRAFRRGYGMAPSEWGDGRKPALSVRDDSARS